jgi:hypothetical protein
MQIVEREYDVKLRVTVRGTRRDLHETSVAQDIATTLTGSEIATYLEDGEERELTVVAADFGAEEPIKHSLRTVGTLGSES